MLVRRGASETHGLASRTGVIWGAQILVRKDVSKMSDRELRAELTTARAYYTDDDGKDWDIEEMRAALIAIHANTAPKAISLSPRLRITAIHKICKQAMPDGY